ncbi:hypothetical protein [Tepidibacter formicigenes]|uniref:Stage V sporulation protein AA n=1 Tax=Tepidibacter formicigenes DSM 15518 TaxID=1123349 RepID=A0A1M6NP83_9FIRM|nr:hypothetical protein [Tepidibacter formicigenes]SHJ97547.1 stage V sporulation protein AA [Tepidibacter formicigenes DSM 15518]
MMQIYLIPKKNLRFNKNIDKIVLKDLFDIYPSEKEILVKDIVIKEFQNINKDYDVIELGDVINKINLINDKIKINFLDNSNLLIHFKNNKQDRTLFIRVILVCIILFLGAGMAIINFHSDVNMNESHRTILRILTGNKNKDLLFLQIPYSLGIGVGVAVFYNKIIPNFSKSEPSPLELEVSAFKTEVQNYIIENNEE